MKYQDPLRDFTKAFCTICGAGVPHINRSETRLVIPAGSLVDSPTISPSANLFTADSPGWFTSGMPLKSFKRWPSEAEEEARK